MTVSLRLAGVTKPVTGMHLRIGGATKAVERAWLRTDGALKEIFASLSASLSSSSVSGFGSSHSTIPISTTGVTAIVVGGVAPLSYLWTRTDGGGHAWTINSPTSATTNFTTSVAVGAEQDATFACAVTDSAGQSVSTGSVGAACINDYFS
jgi:hypothetical protein